MPTAGSARAAVRGKIVHISILLGGSQGCRFARIETDGHHLKLLPGLEIHDPERGHHPIEHLITKHRALVIDQRQHHWLLSEVVAEFHACTILVFEHEIERKLFVEFLIDAYILKTFWQATRCPRFIRPRTV